MIDLEKYRTRWTDSMKPAWNVRPDIEALIAEIEALRERVVELEGALQKYGQHLLDFKPEGPPETWGCRVGITDLSKDCRCGFTAVLHTTPAKALERARAVKSIKGYFTVIRRKVREHPPSALISETVDTLATEALAKLDALGTEE